MDTKIIKTSFYSRCINTTLKDLITTFVMATLMLVTWCGPAWSEIEVPIALPKAEGSKTFDFDIDQINNRGINYYQEGNFQEAIGHFQKALDLARQLRDPSQGILTYNLALGLHKSGQHDEATKQFYQARRFARGNKKILESELLKLHECGLNPSVLCENKVPLEINIEGSH